MREKQQGMDIVPRLHRELVDFLFPPRCVGCRQRGFWLCESCRSAAPRVPIDICSTCGCPTHGLNTCSTCWKTHPRFDALRARYYFEGTVRQAIHLFKYRGARYLLEDLAQMLLESVQPSFLGSDAVVPVPLHEKRLRERSYNQSQLLASAASASLGISLVDNSLVRLRHTEPQMQLPAEARLKNVHGAFACQDRTLEGKNVLLVDDVCTTGATLDQCAAALKKAGATTVWAICVARAR